MEDQVAVIKEATEAFRDVTMKFFEFQPMTKLILDTYNEFVDVTLENIIRMPLDFKTDRTVGRVEFQNVQRVPPFKGEIVLKTESERLSKLRTDHLLARQKWSRENQDKLDVNGKMREEDDSEFSRRELEERNALLVSLYKDSPRANWLLASECRDDKLSYTLSIYADIVIHEADRRSDVPGLMDELDPKKRFTEESDPDDSSVNELSGAKYFDDSSVLKHTIRSRSLPFVKLFEVPLMLGSRWDWLVLSGVPKEKWSAFGECNLNPMCNFIVKGSEKVFITQIKLAPNVIRCLVPSGANSGSAPKVIAEIRSESPVKRSSVLKLAFTRVKGQTSVKTAKILMMSLGFIMRKGKEAQGEDEESKAKNPKDMTFNVLWIFRLFVIWRAQVSLGPEGLEDGRSTQIMLEEFNQYLKDACQKPGDDRSVNTYRKVIEELLDTIRHARASDMSPKNDKKFVKGLMEEYNYIGLTSKASPEAAILKFKAHFDAELFPHIVVKDEYMLPEPNEDWKPYPKFTALVHMIVKYVKCFVGAKPVDDLNHFSIQQMATAGIELGILTQKAFNYVRGRVKYTLESKGSESELSNAITNFGDRNVTAPLSKAFSTGEWGLERGTKRAGVVQQHDQSAKNSQWSIIRKAAIPMKKQSQISVPRQVHRTGYGIVDPTNTPDSAQVGLVKYFAVGAYITTDNVHAHQEVLRFVEDKLANLEMSLRRDEIEDEAGNQPIPLVVNNTIVGYGPESLVTELRAMKRSGAIGYYTEVFTKIEIDHWETVKEIHVLTTAGRAMRPLVVVSEDQRVPLLDWVVEHMGLSKAEAFRNRMDFANLLNEGVVEFVSASEFDYSHTAETYKDFIWKTARGQRFDYIELDPYMGMSVEIASIPFPGLNPNPRILYAAGMARQPVGVPNANFMNRMDTDFKILTYPHKPIVTTDMAKITGFEEQPYGNNVIVAIVSMPGTDEDATLWKREFFERGGLNGTLYETITDLEFASFAPEATKDPAIYDHGLIRIRRRSDEETQKILDEQEEFKVASDASPGSGSSEAKEIKEFADEDEEKSWPFTNFGRLTGKTSVLVRPGDLLAAFRSGKDENSDIEKYKLAGKRSGFVHSLHQTGSGVEKVQKIVIRFPHVPKEGDKFANRFAQKGVGGGTKAAIDMPSTLVDPRLSMKSITPDVIFSPTSFTSRMTAGMTAEILMGGAMTVCDTRRFVSRLLKWERGMPRVEYDLTNDFWIVLSKRLVSKDTNETINYMSPFELWTEAKNTLIANLENDRADVQEYLKMMRRVEPTSDFELQFIEFEDEVTRARYSRFEKVFLETLAKYEKQGWKVVHGLELKVDEYRMKFLAPRLGDITTLQTGEHAILFSQLPTGLQIQWYNKHYADIVPNYLMRFDEATRYPSKPPHIKLGDATAFRNPEYDEIARILHDKGYQSLGEHKFQHGESGKTIPGLLFMGPCHWMQLKHLTDSKYQTRDTGSMSVLTRNATKGRGLGGAVRSGELSHSAMIAHGNMPYLAERFMTAADKYDVLICTQCGGQCYTGGKVPKPICETCGSQKNPRKVTMPYSGVRFLSIMTAAGQRPHFTTRDHPDYVGHVEGEFEFEEGSGEKKERIRF